MTIERTPIFRYVGQDNSFSENDYLSEARDLVTTQFKDRDVFDRYLQLILSGTVDLNTGLKDLMEKRSLHNATGKQLDVIGDIVGQSRALFESTITSAFGFFGASGALSFGTDSDSTVGGEFRSVFDSNFGSRELDDDEYRTLIKVKILQNTSVADITSLTDAAELLFGSDYRIVYQEDEAVLTVNIGRPYNDSESTVFPGIDEVNLAKRFLNVPLGVALQLQQEESLNLDFVNQEYSYFLQGTENSPTSFSGLIDFSRASTATYIDSSGVIQTAAVDEPRFSHNPTTLEPLGLLMEEERENLLLQSEAFDTADWSKINSTITADTTSAPDGNTTADKLVEDSSDAAHVARQSYDFVSGVTYTASIFVKAEERTELQMYFTVFGNWDTTPTSYFDLVEGTASDPNAFIEEWPNGWFRVGFTSTCNTSYTGNLSNLLVENGSNSYLGDGSSGLYLWGAQLEEGEFATSYIKTTGSTATRSVDLAKITPFGDWYNDEEGTLFIENNYYQPTNGNEFALSINDDSYSNRIAFNNDGGGAGGFRFVDNNAGEFYSRDGEITDDSFVKAAASYSVFDYQISVRQEHDFFSQEDPAILSELKTIDIGSNQADINNLNGHIKQIKYYPRKLSPANIVLETGPDTVNVQSTETTLTLNFAGGYSTLVTTENSDFDAEDVTTESRLTLNFGGGYSTIIAEEE